MSWAGWRRETDLALLVLGVWVLGLGLVGVVGCGQSGFGWARVAPYGLGVLLAAALARRTHEPLIVMGMGLAILGALLARAWMIEAGNFNGLIGGGPWQRAAEALLGAAAIAVLGLVRLCVHGGDRRGRPMGWCTALHGVCWAFLTHQWGIQWTVIEVGLRGARFHPVGWVWTGLACAGGVCLTSCALMLAKRRSTRAVTAALGAWFVGWCAWSTVPRWKTPDEAWDEWWYEPSTTALPMTGEFWCPLLMITGEKGNYPYVQARRGYLPEELPGLFERFLTRWDPETDWFLFFHSNPAGRLEDLEEPLRLALDAGIHRVAIATKLPRAPRGWPLVVADLAVSNGPQGVLPLPPLLEGAELVFDGSQPFRDLVAELDDARQHGRVVRGFWIE